MSDTLRNSKVDLLITKDVDMHQRRIVNAAPSLNRNDYVIKKELDKILDFSELKQDLVFSGVIKFQAAVAYLGKIMSYKLANFLYGVATNLIKSYDDTLPLVVQADTVSVAATTKLGFWGTAPATKQTLNSYVSNSQSVAYAGIASGVAGIPYAQVADVNALRVAYQNLRAMVDDLRTKSQNTTLVG